MLSGQKLPGYQLPFAVISYSVWLYHRFALSYRDVEELSLEWGIAALLGTVPELVSRKLGHLYRHKLIRLEGRRVWIPDPGALASLIP